MAQVKREMLISEILSNMSKKGVALGQRPELVGGGLVSRWLMQ